MSIRSKLDSLRHSNRSRSARQHGGIIYPPKISSTKVLAALISIAAAIIASTTNQNNTNKKKKNNLMSTKEPHIPNTIFLNRLKKINYFQNILVEAT